MKTAPRPLASLCAALRCSRSVESHSKPRDRPAPGCLDAGLGPSWLRPSSPGALDSYTIDADASIGFREPLGGGTVLHEYRTRAYLPAPRKHEALKKLNCKIANSLDDVFIAEGGRVVKTISRPKCIRYNTATQPCSARVMSIIQGPKTILRLRPGPPSFPVLGAAIQMFSAGQAR